MYVTILQLFCVLESEQICGHFEQSLQGVANIITTSVYQKREMGFVLVRCGPVEEVARYGVSYFYIHNFYPLVCMRSESYCSWVCVCVCVSVNSHLTSGASVRPENTVTYSAGNRGQKTFGFFSETAPFQRSSTAPLKAYVWSGIFLRKVRMCIIRKPMIRACVVPRVLHFSAFI